MYVIRQRSPGDVIFAESTSTCGLKISDSHLYISEKLDIHLRVEKNVSPLKFRGRAQIKFLTNNYSRHFFAKVGAVLGEEEQTEGIPKNVIRQGPTGSRGTSGEGQLAGGSAS